MSTEILPTDVVQVSTPVNRWAYVAGSERLVPGGLDVLVGFTNDEFIRITATVVLRPHGLLPIEESTHDAPDLSCAEAVALADAIVAEVDRKAAIILDDESAAALARWVLAYAPVVAAAEAWAEARPGMARHIAKADLLEAVRRARGGEHAGE